MSKEFLESLVTDNAEGAFVAFDASVNEKLTDALEVRRVEIASSIMGELPVVEEEVDPQELQESENARELVLYADNDEHLYRTSHQPIVKNLQRKHAKGIYDHEKATKLWGYHADRAAQKYHKEFGSGGKWHHMFSKTDRMKAAKQFADQGKDELEESFSKKANRESGLDEYVVLPATSILKSASQQERDKTKRYAKYNKAIRNKDGLPKDKDHKNKVDEVAAPGQEDWIKSNKKRFIDRYGKEKGTKILYAKAWKLAKEGYLDEAQAQAKPQTKPAAGPSNAQLHRNVSSNLQRAIQTLKIKGVNPSMAANAHKDFAKLVAKNPKAPGHMLLRKLSAQKASQIQSLSQAGVPMGQSLEANPQDFNQVLTRMKRFR